jgi:predicted Zn-dependent protease
MAMASFLKSLESHAALESAEQGRSGNQAPSYLSTHPVTAQRVSQSKAEASQFEGGNNNTNRIDYLKAINGMIVGDSPAQGFVDDNHFVHPELGFKLALPANYITENSPETFIAKSKSRAGGAIILSSGKKQASESIDDFLRLRILKGDMSNARDFGTNTINGIKTASVERTGSVNNMKANIRTIAFEWSPTTVFILTLAMPEIINQAEVKAMQQSAFSFKRMSVADKQKYRPKRISFRVAKAGDTVAKMAAQLPYNDNLNERRFRVINGMGPNEQLQARQAYKLIVQ